MRYTNLLLTYLLTYLFQHSVEPVSVDHFVNSSNTAISNSKGKKNQGFVNGRNISKLEISAEGLYYFVIFYIFLFYTYTINSHILITVQYCSSSRISEISGW